MLYIQQQLLESNEQSVTLCNNTRWFLQPNVKNEAVEQPWPKR